LIINLILLILQKPRIPSHYLKDILVLGKLPIEVKHLRVYYKLGRLTIRLTKYHTVESAHR